MARFLGFLLIASPIVAGEIDSTQLHSRWHVIIGMSGSNLSSSKSIRSTYISQYPFVAIPKFYNPQFGLQRNITSRLRVGAEVNVTPPVSYRASNWYKLVSQSRVAPATRFDIYEKVSGFSGQILAHLVLAPVRYTITRFEVAVSAGMSVSRANNKVRHEYVFCQNGCSQDTTFTRSASGTMVGAMMGLHFDFYWTRNVSTQFRMTGRSTTSFSVKPVRYTYVTLDLRGQNPTSNERVVGGHSFSLSGVDLALSLLLHL